jgi:hypothetical protein
MLWNYRIKFKSATRTSTKDDSTFDFHFKKISQEVSLKECFILGRFRVQTPAYKTVTFTEDMHKIFRCLWSLDIVD